MRALLSPYELDEWSPAAMAALLLFDSAATLRPEPAPRPDESRPTDQPLTARQSPALASLLDRWHWTAPLWRNGVLVPDAGGHSVFNEARRAADAFQTDPRLAPIHRLTSKPWHDDHDQATEALAGDLLRNGPNPSIHLPVIAALETLAAQSGGVLCRGEGEGILGRLERRAGSRPLARFAIPTLIGADGPVLLAMREQMAPQRETVIQALNNTLAVGANARQTIALLDATDAYAHAFDAGFRSVPVLRGSNAADGVRRTLLVISIASTSPAPTLGATARLASIVGGRRHDRQLATAASACNATHGAPPIPDPMTQTEHLLVATVKRVAWEPMRTP